MDLLVKLAGKEALGLAGLTSDDHNSIVMVSQVRAFAHIKLIHNSFVTGVTDSLPETSQTYIFESKRTSI